MSHLTFAASVELHGKTATGIEVPAVILAQISSGKRTKVRITIGPHTYRTTVAVVGGRYLVPLSAENRSAAGVQAGDDVEVGIAFDDAPRAVAVPADLRAILDAEPAALAFFDGLPYSHRKEWVRWIEDAKREQTRTARLTATLDALRAGRRSR